MDLIDRQAFISEMNNRIDAAIKWGVNAIADRNDEIKVRAEQAVATFCEASLTAKNLPPAQQWIPVTERMPDMHDEVLVTARGEVSIAWLYVDGKWRSNDMPQPMFGDITAWMPLPEPYKGEEGCG